MLDELLCQLYMLRVSPMYTLGEGAADQSRANQLTKNISPQPYKAAPRIPKDTKPFSLKHQKIPPPPFTPQLPSTQQCFSLASASYFTVCSPQYLIFKRY